jgi:asparagine N-glycosylation enzyme membrane subunit Stt3
MKIQIPFAVNKNPVTNTIVMLTGAANVNVITFTPELRFGANQLRFDGVQMDQYGSVINSGGTSARYVGVAEFTARDWKEQIPVPMAGGGFTWTIREDTPGLRYDASFSGIDNAGMPTV